MSSFFSRLRQSNNSPSPPANKIINNNNNEVNNNLQPKKTEVETEFQKTTTSWDDKYSINYIELLEDSPLAREKLHLLENLCERTSNKLKKVISISKQYQQIGNSFKEISKEFGSELMNWDYSELPNNEIANKSFFSNIKQLGQSILELNDYQSMLLVQMGNVFIQPIEQYLQEELTALKFIRKKHSISRNKYENSLVKNSQIKKQDLPNHQQRIMEIKNELENDRLLYNVSSFEYLYKLKEFEFSSKVEYIDRACAFLYAEKAYFTQAHSLQSEMEKSLADISKHMALSRKVIDEEKKKVVLRKDKQFFSISSNNKKKINDLEIVGYLFMKRGNKWERQYFGIRGGNFVQFQTNKEKDAMNTNVIINLLLCTVRPAREVDRRFCFEIVSPHETFVFQGEDDDDTHDWIQVIQNGIANQLNKQVSHKRTNSSIVNPALQDFRKNDSNRFCADCNAPDPKWVSINLGVLICIECSGIHRQLGTHISKVRSATLDSWDKELQKLITLLGNDCSKKICEYNAPDCPLRLSCDRNSRETWIREKYVEKKYLLPLPSSNHPPELELHKAVAEENIFYVLQLIMHGVNINWKDDSNQNLTALHIAVMKGFVSIEELLIQNGADLNAQDSKLWTPLHHCAALNRVECAILLIKRGAKVEVRDPNDESPLEVAMNNYQAHCVTLLRLAMHAEREYAKHARNDDSFTHALKDFSDEIERLIP